MTGKINHHPVVLHCNFVRGKRDISATGEHLSVSFGQISNAPAQKVGNCYFWASGHNSDTAVRFGNPDFLHGTDILAIGEHLPCDLDLWYFDFKTLVVYRIRWSHSVQNFSEIEQSANDLMNFSGANFVGASYHGCMDHTRQNFVGT